ncbi:hypothetical protein KIN20_021370 [Parelaphostrongylus tenuis]|uniref:Transmembrane protein n=1 Tax=Parelaphostrongylus tenuis TaxID=148309 RepID=A0AAD5N558_PARTN|nr:hypothetical protein KIN20_021370 [Parelaphostrongylus tenuis]
MRALPITSFAIFVAAIITTAFGCGVVPAGQAGTRTFTVSGFTLPVNMAYSTDSAVAARVPGIATSADGAKGFVQRLVMQTVSLFFGVLESQGRSALLPEAVISTILSQLNVTTNYEPLNCQKVVLSLAEMVMKNDPPSCIIMSNTVTGICTNMNDNMKACMVAPAMMVTITSINNSYSTISGTLSVGVALLLYKP